MRHRPGWLLSDRLKWLLSNQAVNAICQGRGNGIGQKSDYWAEGETEANNRRGSSLGMSTRFHFKSSLESGWLHGMRILISKWRFCFLFKCSWDLLLSMSGPKVIFWVSFLKCLFIDYFWLCWVFIAMRAFSLVAVSEVLSGWGAQATFCGGFSCFTTQTLGPAGFSSCSKRALSELVFISGWTISPLEQTLKRQWETK